MIEETTIPLALKARPFHAPESGPVPPETISRDGNADWQEASPWVEDNLWVLISIL